MPLKIRWRRLLALFAAVLLVCGVSVTAAALPALAATCTTSAALGSCGPYTDAGIYGSGTLGSTLVNNDVWAQPSGFTGQTCASGQSGPPCETISATDAQHWTVTANYANAYGGQVLSYPDTEQVYTQASSGSHPNGDPYPISNFSGDVSSWSSTLPSSATSWDAGYDIWGGSVGATDANWADEIMIWTGQANRAGCGGATPDLTGIQFGGTNGVPVQSWNLYNYGSERIWCNPNMANEASGSVDVYDMLHYLMAPNYTGTGSLPSDFGLNAIEYGVEWCYTNSTYDSMTLSGFTVGQGTGGGGTAPVVSTSAATNVASSGATLNGSVNPEGAATTYQFDYGTTTSYGNSVPVPAGSAGSGTSAVSESAGVTGLSAGTTYHYRVEATNSSGTTYGSDQSFTTSGGGSGGAVTVTASVTNPYAPVNLKTFVVDNAAAGGSVVTSGGYANPTFTLTPQASSSLLLTGAYNASDSTAITPVANVHGDDSAASGSSAFFDGHYTGTVTAGGPVTLGGTDDGAWNAWAGYEAEPSGGTPALDATTPPAVTGTSSSATTASFSPPAGSLLVAVVQANGSAAQTVTMSAAGQSLTWTQAGTTYSPAYEGTEAVFTAVVPGSPPAQNPPAVTTNAATNVASSGATLNGSVNPEGAATTYQFDYGTTTSYGSVIPSGGASAGSGSSAVSESASLTGLSPSTTYHYRVEATNSGGTSFGADQQFTTSASGGGTSVAFDASAGAKAANTGSLSWTHTVGSGSNLALLVDETVGVSNDAGCSPNATYDGIQMTEITAVHSDNQHAGALVVWGLVNPPPGAHTVHVAVSNCTGGTPAEMTGGSESFTGVSQSAPFGAHAVGYGSGATSTAANTSTSTGDLEAEFVANGSAVVGPQSPAVQKFLENQDGNTGAGNTAGGYMPASGGSDTAHWNLNSDWWGAAAVDISHA